MRDKRRKDIRFTRDPEYKSEGGSAEVGPYYTKHKKESRHRTQEKRRARRSRVTDVNKGELRSKC